MREYLRGVDGKIVLPVAATISVALVPVFLAALRVLTFSRGDRTLAALITSTLNVRAIVSYSLVSVLPVLLLCAGFYILLHYPLRFADTADLGLQPAVFFVGAVSTLLGLLFLEIAYILPIIGLGLLISLVRLCRTRSGRSALTGAREFFGGSGVAWLLAGIIVVITVVSTQSWLPLEVVKTRDSPPQTSYVLDNSGGFLTTLTWPDFIVRRVPTVEIMGREVCTQPRKGLESNVVGLMSKPVIRECPGT